MKFAKWYVMLSDFIGIIGYLALAFNKFTTLYLNPWKSFSIIYSLIYCDIILSVHNNGPYLPCRLRCRQTFLWHLCVHLHTDLLVRSYIVCMYLNYSHLMWKAAIDDTFHSAHALISLNVTIKLWNLLLLSM